jgi:hypothetical protein
LLSLHLATAVSGFGTAEQLEAQSVRGCARLTDSLRPIV